MGDTSTVQAWRMGTQMHDLHPLQMLTEVIFRDRPDTETVFFGQMINKLHPLYSSPIKIENFTYDQFLSLQRCHSCQTWMFDIIFKVFIKTLHWTERRFVLSKLKAFWYLLPPSQVLTGNFTFTYPRSFLVCVWLVSDDRTNVEDSGQQLYLQMTTGRGEMGYGKSRSIRR